MDDSEQRSRQRRLLYGRRKGPRLSGHQASLRATLLPQLALTLEPGRDPREYFPNSVREIWLEVGFGAGEHLLWQAKANPDIGLLGAEPYEMGVAKLLSHIFSLSPLGGEGSGQKISGRTFSDDRTGEGEPYPERPPHLGPLPQGGRGSGWSNIRLYEGDGRDIIDALPDACLGRFFLLFPDPWPKTRHHKRRFLQMEMLDQLARVLKPGAELRFATDDKSYLPYALERLMAHPGFIWLAEGPADWKIRPQNWPPTRYEAKAIKGPPTYLRFVRQDKIRP